jgi:hypothetical protein
MERAFERVEAVFSVSSLDSSDPANASVETDSLRILTGGPQSAGPPMLASFSIASITGRP